jgi:hypothetical protein
VDTPARLQAKALKTPINSMSPRSRSSASDHALPVFSPGGPSCGTGRLAD